MKHETRELSLMPFYEYACKECGHRFERFQRMSDDPVKICPECNGEVIRIVQPVGVIFKGSGFYVTDNRGSSSTAPGSNHKPTNGDSDHSRSEESSSGDSSGKSEETSSSTKTESKDKAEKTATKATD